jgi:hypothetical protein
MAAVSFDSPLHHSSSIPVLANQEGIPQSIELSTKVRMLGAMLKSLQSFAEEKTFHFDHSTWTTMDSESYNEGRDLFDSRQMLDLTRKCLAPMGEALKGQKVLEIGSGPLCRGESFLSHFFDLGENLTLSDLCAEKVSPKHPYISLDLMNIGDDLEKIQGLAQRIILADVLNAVDADDLDKMIRNLHKILPEGGEVFSLVAKLPFIPILAKVFYRQYPGAIVIPFPKPTDPDSYKTQHVVLHKSGVEKLIKSLEANKQAPFLLRLLKDYNKASPVVQEHFLDSFMTAAVPVLLSGFISMLTESIKSSDLSPEEYTIENSLKVHNRFVAHKFRTLGFEVEEHTYKQETAYPRADFLKHLPKTLREAYGAKERQRFKTLNFTDSECDYSLHPEESSKKKLAAIAINIHMQQKVFVLKKTSQPPAS